MKKRLYKQRDITANPNKYPQKIFKEKECRWCKKIFQPLAPSHMFCSDICKDSSYTNSYFKTKYGISFDKVKQMLEDQDYKCAICKTEGFKMHPNSWSKLNVDHCHHTNEIRGMLCHNCNRALGLFQDNKDILESAIRYLESATTISKESTLK